MAHNHYCQACGRDIYRDYACLHKKKLTKIEVMIMYLMVIILPILLIPRSILFAPWSWSSFLFSTALALSMILIMMTILNVILNRPYLALFFGCHQKKERSPKVFGRAWVLCSRCSGIYLGMILMLMSYWLILPWWVYFTLSIPLILDGTLQHKNIVQSNTIRRWITGVFFGFFLVFIINIMIYGMMTLSSWIVKFF